MRTEESNNRIRQKLVEKWLSISVISSPKTFLCLRVLSEHSIASPLSPLGMTVQDSFSSFLHQVVPSPYCEKSKLFDTFFLSNFWHSNSEQELCAEWKNMHQNAIFHTFHILLHIPYSSIQVLCLMLNLAERSSLRSSKFIFEKCRWKNLRNLTINPGKSWNSLKWSQYITFIDSRNNFIDSWS